ncbi:DNA helicase RecQ [Candidatus Merdisoma sp. JLR.KK006]|uniref:DNA helicase RecQ n=1 Tax=Candidatus Merdisoma sp. JLR.KK006 TaxID=3112626 RepID=UPI002FF16547
MTPQDILKTYFGYDSFRRGQEDIIHSILEGRDALAVMPTGAGKSICYQVPALLLPGITLVISPLISLMQDQVKSLNEAGIHAAFINSSLTEAQVSKALGMARKGTYKIIYVAPERLESAGFLDFALNAHISMITVDEAHCISQWGQDFRPSYLKIVDFIERLPRRPVVSAFTATATEEVKIDIECILKLKEPSIIVTGFDRENLYYQVEHISGKNKDAFVTDYISRHRGESGIIYCATRKNVDTLYENLFKGGVPVTRYHAGIDNELRKKNQDDFIYDRTPIIIATNAFGMGIDKSNVRFVIHYNMPQSMENYYQEAGRAGRDGENSQCILLFSPQDVMINKFLLEKKEFEGSDEDDIELIRQRDAQRLRLMEGYCKSTSCLRQYILNYFGEKMNRPCDNCGNCHREYTAVDMTEDAKWVINCLAETRGRYGQSIVTGTLLGANRARLREIGATAYKSYGALAHRSEREVRLLIDQMLLEEYITRTDGEYSVLRIGNIERLKNEDTHVVIRTFAEKEGPAKIKGGKKRSTDTLTSAGYRLFEKLRSLRLVIAREEGMPPYIIFNDKTLIDMCARIPENKQEMLQVSGVAENKFRKYGQRFLDEIAEFVANNPGAVISTKIEDETEAEAPAPEKKQRRKKGAFYLNPQDGEAFPYTEYCYISDIKERLNGICSAEYVKKITTTVIWEQLVLAGLTAEEKQEDKTIKVQTEEGLNAGIKTIDRVGPTGYHYQLLMYPEKVQRMLVEAFTGPRD